ncbi:chemotaxis protein CheC [Chromatiaceae bacterium AAb-1]|nr:chemotaxis protein CheC [Chromatiaceae bacterium AAb-1]
MPQFSELQKDALCEIFNISVSQAAAAMSEIIRATVKLTVPKVEICDVETAVAYLNQGNARICGVSQTFHGSFDGKAILIFPEERSLELVRLMMGIDVPMELLTDMEQDALAEVGNIVLNACLASLSDMFSQQFDCELPQLVEGNSLSLLQGYGAGNVLILLHIKFSVAEHALEGYIIFVVNAHSMKALEQSVDKFLQGAGDI